MGEEIIEYRGLRIEVCEGVYKPAEDTFLFLDNINCGKKVLEIGTGTGIISIFCARSGSDVTAVDVSEKAVACAVRNAELNQVKIRALVSNLFDGVTGVFDTIIFNPPYLPTEDRIEGSEQWDGGADGFSVTRPFLKASTSHLGKDGVIYLLLSDLTNIEGFKSEFPALRFAELSRKSFFYERIILYQITVA